MKKVFSFLLTLMLGMFIFCSCSEDEPVPPPEPPVNLNTLAGNKWTLQEGNLTTCFEFLDNTNMTVTETSGSASLKITRAGGTKTFTGTYTYDHEAKTAEFKYNNRTRQLTKIEIGDNSVSCEVDGVAVTMAKESTPVVVVDNDKQFLEDTGKEFVGMFTAEQAAPYTSIINVIRESSTEEIDEEIDDIIDGLTTNPGSDPNVYKYAIKAAAFQGRYVLSNGVWYKQNSSGHTAEFTDDKGRQCKLTVTTSGTTKKVIVYEEERDHWNGYTMEYREYTYEAELPSHINCVLTQSGNTLINIVVDINLSNLSDGQKINLARNSLSFTCTADFAGVAKINMSKVSYQAGGTSEVSFDIEKNGRKILTANATGQSRLQDVAPYDLDDDDLKNVTNTHLDLNVLDKVQIKGVCSNIGSMVDALEKADDYETRYDEQAVRQYVSQANTFLTQADVYYNKDYHTRRAYLKFDVDYRESYYWDYNTSTSYPRNKYIPTSSICFPDGSSYFVEKYFSEDAFKSLVDMFNDLTDKVEGQIN